jgi:hypothetical protein
MLDCAKLFPHICTVGVLPLLLPLLLLLLQLPALPLPPQAAKRAAARLTRTNNNANFFMVSLLLLTSDPHLYIVRFVQAIRSDNLLADAVGSPLFRKRAAQLPVVLVGPDWTH